MLRSILHCDLNNFFASVECLRYPELKDKCMAVGGNTEQRKGIILAKNENAKKYGVKTGEAIWEAKLKCPDLVTVSPHYSDYAKYSGIVKDIYKQYTDMVEPFGIDECWLDVTGSYNLFGDKEKIADEIRNKVKMETGLTISVGVSFNKVFAKLGSDIKKPDAVTVIEEDSFRNQIWHLPSSAMIGVGRSTEKKLTYMGISTLGELAQMPVDSLKRVFGVNGITLWKNANGLDDSPVLRECDIPPFKSVSRGVTLPKDVVEDNELGLAVLTLCEKVCNVLQKNKVKSHIVKIALKSTNLTVREYSKRLTMPTQLVDTVFSECMLLAQNHRENKSPVRAVTVGVSEIVNEDMPYQLSLDNDILRSESIQSLEDTVFELRERFGYKSVIRASLLNYEWFDDINGTKALLGKSVQDTLLG